MNARSIGTLIALAALSVPAVAATPPDSPIIVTEPRATADELITRQVVDTLSSDARLAGRIGVQTVDGEVELSGIVTNASLSRLAERDAKGVQGVRNVRNLLATRMGTSRN